MWILGSMYQVLSYTPWVSLPWKCWCLCRSFVVCFLHKLTLSYFFPLWKLKLCSMFELILLYIFWGMGVWCISTRAWVLQEVYFWPEYWGNWCRKAQFMEGNVPLGWNFYLFLLWGICSCQSGISTDGVWTIKKSTESHYFQNLINRREFSLTYRTVFFKFMAGSSEWVFHECHHSFNSGLILWNLNIALLCIRLQLLTCSIL